jgi:hypothetical protein
LVYCTTGLCHHSAIINADRWPDETELLDLDRRAACGGNYFLLQRRSHLPSVTLQARTLLNSFIVRSITGFWSSGCTHAISVSSHEFRHASNFGVGADAATAPATAPMYIRKVH